MTNIAVIPARGGSQRIPKKNIKPFLGKPIIEYSIEAAKKSNLFDRIIISTDSQEIAQCAQLAGAEVPFIRPKSLADHFTGTQAVMAHALKACEDDNPVDYACCIYATSPLLTADALIDGFKLIRLGGCDYVVSATEFEFPIQRAIKPNGQGFFIPEHNESMAKRSQDLEPMYHDAAQFYWGTPWAYKNDLPIWGQKTRASVLPRSQVQDIDTPEDWVLAEMKYQQLK